MIYLGEIGLSMRLIYKYHKSANITGGHHPVPTVTIVINAINHGEIGVIKSPTERFFNAGPNNRFSVSTADQSRVLWRSFSACHFNRYIPYEMVVNNSKMVVKMWLILMVNDG